MDRAHEGGVAIALGTVLVGGIIAYFRFKKVPRVYPADTVILHMMGRAAWTPSSSPFVIKLETYLCVNKIPYQVEHGQMSSKGKMPWITYNGQDVADSQFCVEFLNDKLNINLNKHLTNKDKAIARAFQKMAEENLYWTICGAVFGPDLDMSVYAKTLPYGRVKSWVFARILRYLIRKQMWSHGMGRHTDQEIWHIGKKDLEAISTFLGDKEYFMGSEPSEVDCLLFGMLSVGYYHETISIPHQRLMKSELLNLCEYCERMKTRYWPDWDDCITHGGTKEATK